MSFKVSFRVSKIFKSYIIRLREAFFTSRREDLKKINENFMKYTSEEKGLLDAKETAQVEGMLQELKNSHGYSVDSARDAVAYLLKHRYSE